MRRTSFATTQFGQTAIKRKAGEFAQNHFGTELVSRWTYCTAYFQNEIIANTLLKARANKTSTGDLQKKLDAQKRQTQTKTLEEAARENLAFRNADAQAKEREHN